MISYNNLALEKYSLYLNEKISRWITHTIEKEGYKAGNINYIFVRDEQLIEINKKFLQHDTYTDIITFQTSDNQDIISSEIYISLDRILENSKKFNVPSKSELFRVMIHGILHMLGYDDHTPEEKTIMRAKENYYLTLLPKQIDEMFHVKH